MEDIDTTGRRELYEETGARVYTLKKICIYSVEDILPEGKTVKTLDMLYYADITGFDVLPRGYEMEEIVFLSELPENLTYPGIQPLLIDKVNSFLKK